MEVKCEYCGSMISDKDEKCPNCGAPNEHMARMVNGTPKTIEELKQWYAQRGLPPEEVTRFFIGKNVTEARAFGIYEENGRYIVYKNKDDGSRAVRYSGTDEAYAVNEIYLKLKSEILKQKEHNASPKKMTPWERFKEGLWKPVLIFIIVLYFIGFTSGCNDGYYRYGNDYYYKHGSNWYYYDNDYSTYYETSSTPFGDDYKDYSTDDSPSYQWSDYASDNGISDNWNSNYNWNSGSDWNSGGTNWGSNW